MFNFRAVFGLVLILSGIILSVLINYFTVGPFGSTEGVVQGTEYRLSSHKSYVLVQYAYQVADKQFEGSDLVPVRDRKGFGTGTPVFVNYMILNPYNSTLFSVPKPSPLFLLSGLATLFGILISYSGKVSGAS